MTASELKTRLFRVVGVESPGSAPAHLLDAVANAVNHAYQVLWVDVPKARREEYTRVSRTYEVGPGETSIDLPADVQGVLPPVRSLPERLPLLIATHRSEIEGYLALSPGAPAHALAFVSSTHRNDPDSMRLQILLAPPSSDPREILVDIEIKAPRLAPADFCGDPGPHLRVPHEYAEGILLPIAAYHMATQSRWFRGGEEVLAPIKEGYEAALLRAGIVSPSTTAPREALGARDR